MIHRKIDLGEYPRVDKLRQVLATVPEGAELRVNATSHRYEVHWMEPENDGDRADLVAREELRRR